MLSKVIPPDRGPLEPQLREMRRAVDFDTFDIHLQQLLSMLSGKQIKIAPAYQRKFRWNDERCSQFVESMMLGIPVPSLFMATNADSTWEVVDGVQRLGTIVKFAGDEALRRKSGHAESLNLQGLEKLTSFNGRTFERLPPPLQLHFVTRPIKVITLNDKSDLIVRYDLFERLNTGGVALTPQEIRDCVYRGPFADKLEEWSKNRDFRKVVRFTSLQEKDATAEECVLRFFAYRQRYLQFDHGVASFLTEFMESATSRFDYLEGDRVFEKTFRELAKVYPNGIRRPGGKAATPLNLFEGIAVGASLALDKRAHLVASGLEAWMPSPELRGFTTGATNDRPAVRGRIEFCRDRFLGKPYVPADPS